MSFGGVVGGVLGGVVGFFIGGPMGAIYGAGIGFGVGLLFDPMSADVAVSGSPAPGTQVMSSTVGDPIPDLNGTAMITGHLLLFGKERTEEIIQTQEAQGGKGGEPEPQSQVVGHKYFMSWAVGIVKGPITKLFAIYENDTDVLWEGELSVPASGGQETVVLAGMGSCTFYFGTDDQVANAKVGEIIDSTLNSPLRGFCWAFMDDCYIGDYNRTPSLKFVVSKQPEFDFTYPNIIEVLDYNPMSSIWYILSQMVNLPETWLNEAIFASVAGTLEEEKRGISILFDKQQSALYYLEMINSHIDGVLRYSSDGKFNPKLIRNDYSISDLPLIDESVMLDEPTLNRGSWIDTLNEIKIQYTEIIGERNYNGILYGTGNAADGAFGVEDPPGSYINYTQINTNKWRQISVGNNSTLAIKEDGTLWGCGLNDFKQLGLGAGSPNYVLVFTQIGTDNDWKYISAGYRHSMAIKEDGTLWATGLNANGQLGTGNTTNLDEFTLLSDVGESVYCGYDCTYLVNKLGQVLSTGANTYGQLGVGDFLQKLVFTGTNFTDCKKCSVAASGVHAALLKNDGSIWTTGRNQVGQLGVGDSLNKNIFTQIVGGSSGFKDVYAEGLNTWAIKEDGTLWGCGGNSAFQLATGNITPSDVLVQEATLAVNWRKIIGSSFFVLAIKEDGTLWGCGLNSAYQLGVGHNNSVLTFTQEITENKFITAVCGTSYAIAIK